MHEEQCLRHNFPGTAGHAGFGDEGWDGDDLAADEQRLVTLTHRARQVLAWQQAQLRLEPEELANERQMSLNWTKSSSLQIKLGDGGKEVRKLETWRDGHIVKHVSIDGVSERSDRVHDDTMVQLFGPLDDRESGTRCQRAAEVSKPLAHILLEPPHGRSAALRDLLLVMGDLAKGFREEGQSAIQRWPRAFIVISALSVPGDIDVIFEGPRPLSMKGWKTVRFDYVSEALGLQSTSPAGDDDKASQSKSAAERTSGQVRVHLPDRIFHLHGNPHETQVGLTSVDIIANAKEAALREKLGGEARGIYVHVNFSSQDEQQCVAYVYPPASALSGRGESKTQLAKAAQQHPQFLRVAEIHGEDCSIFTVPIGRRRQVVLWVDSETMAVLRVEVVGMGPSGRRILRRTDVLRWELETGNGVQTASLSAPRHDHKSGMLSHLSTALHVPDSWHCTEEEKTRDEQLAFLGIAKSGGDKHWSLELREALEALRDLPEEFALIEVLALVGDVSLAVRNPGAPDLKTLPAASFNFSMLLEVPSGAGGLGAGNPSTKAEGSLAVSPLTGSLRTTSSMAGVQVAIALEPYAPLKQTRLAVRVEEGGSSKCLTMDLPPKDPSAEANNDRGPSGIFEGVEMVGDKECNRFRYAGAGRGGEDVLLWFSHATMEVCRLRVQERVVADFALDSWEVAYTPGAGREDPLSQSLASAPLGWTCSEANAESWLRLEPSAAAAANAVDSLQAVSAVASLATATCALGLLSQLDCDTLSRLVVRSPHHKTDAAPVTRPPSSLGPNIFSKELRGFSFSFTSSRYANTQDSPHASVQTGHGAIHVDLFRRRLEIRSELSGYSRGIPQAESRVAFSGDHGGRLYAMMVLRPGPGEEISFQHCWRSQASAADTSLEPAKNPFLRAKLLEGQAAGGLQTYELHSSSPGLAQRFAPNSEGRQRHLELLVDSESHFLTELLLMEADRLSATVKVRDWKPVVPDVFAWTNFDHESKDCEELDDPQRVAHWDIINIFLGDYGL
eukprot:TRINITY_DN39155_c0_g1_i1.p1 TRINITY_DN39155_c0_g1~~TRINITY_DN39155_c0_g1_i1.p1  ORF type:complete len:1140 (+),score=197.63 TRINITY_DN39155_c0_g1_i1:381-3422(+)